MYSKDYPEESNDFEELRISESKRIIKADALQRNLLVQRQGQRFTGSIRFQWYQKQFKIVFGTLNAWLIAYSTINY
ncbi:hypothetical protein HUJ04_000708 [Dendroctonus ponderosae]|nr:hypothetical protein HUJ04_000708 [Dendroctonus ponderosae]